MWARTGSTSPFSCPKAREHRSHIWCKMRQREMSSEEVLGTPDGGAVFAKWAPATGMFYRRYNGWMYLAKEKMGVFRSKRGQNR